MIESSGDGAGASWRTAFSDDALVKNYYEIYSEPHRRYPTIVYWPRYVIHTATYFETDGENSENKKTARDRFLEWLQSNFGAGTHGKGDPWQRRVANTPMQAEPVQAGEKPPEFRYEEFDGFLRRFVNYLATPENISGATVTRPEPILKEVLFFEATPCAFDASTNSYAGPDPKCRQIISRIEVHEQYFTLTLFVPLSEFGTHYINANNKDYAQIASAGENPSFLEKCYDAIPSALIDAGQIPEFALQIRKLYSSLAEKFKAATFVNFHGAILPHTLIEAAGSPRDAQRLFADADSPGLDRHAPMPAATTFLARHRALFAHSVFAGRLMDVVACYIADGHAIYASNLGSQPRLTHPDRVHQELRFLVLYDANDKCKNPNDPDHPKRIQRWVLSRLIYRMLTMGTLRLHTMRNLEQLLVFERKLTKIEHSFFHNIGQSAHSYPEKELVSTVEKAGRNIFSQIQSAKLSYESMSRLLGDLGVMPIPGWQSYDAFIRRRLDATYGRIANLGEYYKNIWSVYTAKQQEQATRQQEQETRITGALQLVATALASASIAGLIQEPVIKKIFVPWVTGWLKYCHAEQFIYDPALELAGTTALLLVSYLGVYEWAKTQRHVVVNGRNRSDPDPSE